MGEAVRSRVLVGGALVAAVVLVGVYLAAGGSSYTPEKTQDPCKHRAWRSPEGLQEIAQQFTLSALDGAACQLGVSRETLARALATPEGRERFMERYEIGDARLARAVRAGLLRAVDDAEEAGALNPLLAAPLRETLRNIPLDQAIELINNAESLLDNVQGFLGPAQSFLEQFLP
ncbi:MAG: hypothetical protein QOF13_209 [Solirubrobacterales bacterium]|jgi:hypothetical protein|nr:hypothetical protein [Solirubrobacterales bacterium]